MQEVNETNKNIYINGQPFEGIGEIELETAVETVLTDMLEYARLFVPGVTKSTVKITPQLVAMFTRIKCMCRDIALGMAQLHGYEVLPEKEEALTRKVMVYYATVANNRRLFHLCQYSKKHRTRKKNRARLLRLMDEMMKAYAR